MKLIAQATLSGLVPTPHVGINAEADFIAQALRYAGASCTFEEVMGVTASAFRTHFFRLRDNPGMRLGPDPDRSNVIWGPRWAWSSLRHSNYGLAESAAFYYGGEVRDVTDLKAVDTWKVLRFELDGNRPVAAYGLRGPNELDVIVGYRLESGPMRQILLVQASDEATIEFDMTGLDPKGEGAFPRELLLVRPGPVGAHRGSDDARRADAFRWSLFHSRTRRELVYETSRFYATGPAAFEAFGEFLREYAADAIIEPLESTPQDAVADIARFCVQTLQSWITARRAAAIYLRDWAASAKADDRTIEGVQGGPDALDQLAALFDAAAKALDAVLSDLEDPEADIQSAERRDAIAQGLEAARQEELRTVAALAMIAN